MYVIVFSYMGPTSYLYICDHDYVRRNSNRKIMGRGENYVALFETVSHKGRNIVYRLFAVTLFTAIFSIWAYRFSHLFFQGGAGQDKEEAQDGENTSSFWVLWVALFCAELWFGFYWILTQAVRWNPVIRHPSIERLSQRFFLSPSLSKFLLTYLN